MQRKRVMANSPSRFAATAQVNALSQVKRNIITSSHGTHSLLQCSKLINVSFFLAFLCGPAKQCNMSGVKCKSISDTAGSAEKHQVISMDTEVVCIHSPTHPHPSSPQKRFFVSDFRVTNKTELRTSYVN